MMRWRWLYKWPLRFRSLFRRRRVEQELSDELGFHIEKQTEYHITRGMTPEQARCAALRARSCASAVTARR